MVPRSRREFLRDVGRGMVIASVGSHVAADLGFSAAFADADDRLSFGKLEPLVDLMQATPPDRILSLAVEKLRNGLVLKDLVAAAALANARSFGGEDYVGFHTLMAISPAYAMAQETPEEVRPLPVLKVIHRNSRRLHEKSGGKEEVLRPVKAADLPATAPLGETLRDHIRQKQVQQAEQVFAASARKSADDALNDLLIAVQDADEVHRVVLPYRAWDLLGLIGRDHAHTLLRQSVRFCVKGEASYARQFAEVRTLLPKLLDQYKLVGRPLGKRTADDEWVERMSQTLFKSTAAQAAEAAAAVLAEGFAPDALGEAISLAANQLVLRDEGRPQSQAQPNKPVGSCHGDSIGVHACDSANAWRNLARVSNPRNMAACLILGAHQVALDRVSRGGDFLNWQPYPRAEARAKVTSEDPQALLRQAEAAIRDNNQPLASAAVQRYGELGHPQRAVFDLCLKYATSEDGALHAEKYYRTVSEEFATTRPAYRWRQLVALARVTASSFGQPAPGYAEACRLLKV